MLFAVKCYWSGWNIVISFSIFSFRYCISVRLCVCLICEKAAVYLAVSVLNYFVPVYVLVQQLSCLVLAPLWNTFLWFMCLRILSKHPCVIADISWFFHILSPLLLMSSFASDSGYVTVKEMMRALWLPPVTVREVSTLCTRPACSSGSRARTRDAVNCASMSSSWRQNWSLWGR